MKNKRVISGFLCIFITMISLLLGNQYFIDAAFAILAIVAVHEFYAIFKEEARPVKWMGYLAAGCIFFIHIIPNYWIGTIAPFIIPTILTALFIQIIVTGGKTTLHDIMITFFGIGYVVVFTMFISLIRALDNGYFLIWYLIIAAWVTDMFAYYVGSNFGRYKFTKISPNKSIEGCIGGVIGAVLLSLIYTIIINTGFGLNINYWYILLLAALSSVVGQVGDLAASSIKRYVGAKDFGNLIPGHGGILDRFDSMLFIAPFMYALLCII